MQLGQTLNSSVLAAIAGALPFHILIIIKPVFDYRNLNITRLINTVQCSVSVTCAQQQSVALSENSAEKLGGFKRVLREL